MGIWQGVNLSCFLKSSFLVIGKDFFMDRNKKDSKKSPFYSWAVMDSNHRSESQLSYSQPHLATLVTAHSNIFS